MSAFSSPGPLSPAPGPDEPPAGPVPAPGCPGPGAPNVARIYDALLGGKDNYAADRVAARELVAAVPGAVWAARDNRAFLGRAVRFLAADAGISQFIDIGTGLPTRGHVHQVTRTAAPAARSSTPTTTVARRVVHTQAGPCRAAAQPAASCGR